jgi:hypothetical protein
MIQGTITYHRLTYWCDQREDTFHSGTETKNLSVERTVSLVTVYLKRIRSSPNGLSFDNGRIVSDMQQAYIYSITASEMWVEKEPHFSAKEYKEFQKLVRQKWNELLARNSEKAIRKRT